MAPINYSDQIYKIAQDNFSGPVLFTPIKSQPGQPSFQGRGIYSTVAIDIIAEDGSIVSDQRTILDIREVEFAVLPIQGDQVFLAAASFADQLIEDSTFEILDTDTNGGGETTLALRKIMTTLP
jgi:hypothetical protein